MLIEKIDVIGLESAQRPLQGFTKMLGPAIPFAAHLLPAFEAKAELGGDYDLGAPALQCPPEKFLVGEGPIRFCGVEEIAAQVEGAVQRGDRFGLSRPWRPNLRIGSTMNLLNNGLRLVLWFGNAQSSKREADHLLLRSLGIVQYEIPVTKRNHRRNE
jgi:hypothetical protein